MSYYIKIKMPYFTSWDANLYLCLISLGLSDDLAREWVIKMKKIHGEYSLGLTREYYSDRSKFVNMDGINMLYFSRADLNDPFDHFSRSVSRIASIPLDFYDNYWHLNGDYQSEIVAIEPNERNEYFEWAYENHYYFWTIDILDWVKGFHPGRWILMDNKRGENLEDIRELEGYGAMLEEQFIRKKKHIDDIFQG